MIQVIVYTQRGNIVSPPHRNQLLKRRPVVALLQGFIYVSIAGNNGSDSIQARPEYAILPINGAFGNLNGTEAAILAGMLHAKHVIPCHFWTFALHHGNPQEIIDALPRYAPDSTLDLMCQGDSLILN